MSILSLRKLKPYRDMLYIQRTLPSMSTFRLAYRCIKLWAVQCGVYSAKVGFLGGVHITLMLSWVSKSIARDCGSSGAADLVASFFSHFAQFDWINDMMYDAFFHRKLPRYHRSAREPMVILGYHAPNSNIAHTSTVPGLQTLIREAKTAAELLSDPSMTWEQFFGGLNVPHVATDLGIGASRFLQAHTSYVKIDIQFWGRTLAKGKSLVGWVESRCVSLVVGRCF
jgi:poly(A) polymerase Pap1